MILDMATEISESTPLEGLKHFSAMRKLLEPLHAVGTERDSAGNRSLHMDDYCLLILLWLYNPVLAGMRALQQASDLNKVQKKLGVGRASLGSLSESARVFDPAILGQIAEEMSRKLPDRTPEKFDVVDKRITAVDGSVFNILGQVAELAWLPRGDGKSSCGYRLHAQFEVFTGTTSRIDVTTANPKGKADERAVLGRTIESERCYLMDRGYQKYELWNAIHAANSGYVCRTHDNVSYEVISERELTEADRNANIVSDQIVRLGNIPDHTTRLVVVKCNPHDSRRSKNGTSGPNSDGYLRIATNNLEVPAEIIAALFELRWTIELYFRIIKQLLGCRHLLSKKPEGVTIQLYLAIIACIMILSITGKMPTRRTYEMICLYLQGWADLEELEAHIKKLKDK
ncbi:MAG: IS4 family transposase [Planctomycetales bacterium]|nr:IS4 family transposase [Planctomycetales bacterium]